MATQTPVVGNQTAANQAASAASNPAVSAGAEKLAALFRPMLAEALAMHTKVMQEHIEEVIAGVRLDLAHIRAEVDVLAKANAQVGGGNSAKKPAGEDPNLAINTAIASKQEDIIKKLDRIHAAIARMKADAVATEDTEDPTLIKGLPDNVRMRDSGPNKNMFAKEEDEFDLDCD